MSRNIYEEIAKCNNIKELKKVVQSLESLNLRSGKEVSPLDMALRIDEVVEGNAPINLVTRTYGIRAKVCEFLFYKSYGWEY